MKTYRKIFENEKERNAFWKREDPDGIFSLLARLMAEEWAIRRLNDIKSGMAATAREAEELLNYSKEG